MFMCVDGNPQILTNIKYIDPGNKRRIGSTSVTEGF